MHRKKLLLKNPFFSVQNLKIVFVEKYGSFRVSYESFNGFIRNQIFIEFTIKSFRVLYETLKDQCFPIKPLSRSVAERKGLSVKSSSSAFSGRIFKGLVELKNCFLGISNHLDAVSNLTNLSWRFDCVSISLVYLIILFYSDIYSRRKLCINVYALQGMRHRFWHFTHLEQ